jgi:uncharacterized small protein (DUF1192 family)
VTDDELKKLFDSLQQNLHNEIQQGNAELRKEIQQGDVETRRQFGVALEATDHKIQLVAEGVALTREELARVEARLDAKIEHTAAETQAMFKFSHAELDRRMRTLETNFADLQARVERLESSTH